MARGPDKQFDTDEVLARAMEVFWEKGYANAGMSELLDRMGIARKSLYDTFGSKRALFRRALERYAMQQITEIRAALDGGRTPLAGIRRAFKRWLDMAKDPDAPGCLLGNNAAHFAVDDAEMTALINRCFLGLEQTIRGALEKAKEAGEISEAANTRDLARLIVSAVQGVALISRVSEDASMAQGVVRAALTAVEAA